MCGILALFGLDGPLASPDASNRLEQQLHAGLDRITHRGPDAQGVWVQDKLQCALAHCRLAINDLSPCGAQPLHSPDGNIHAIVNGEIYDYDHLRSLSPDYPYAGHSDSELVVALYLQYGQSFLSHLRGEFSLVIYDERDGSFFAARDRYGIKPLFWTRQKGQVWIAAEIKAFLGLGWQAEWDVGAIVSGGWGQDTRTVFKGVQKLRPGHYLFCRRGGEVETRPYWDATYPDKRIQDPRTDQEMIAQTRSLLLESVRLRLRADVPVGIYLSGGIDSSALAGMAAHLVKEEGMSMGSHQVGNGEDGGEGEDRRICCFSIGFDEGSGFDESAISQRTAQHLNVRFLKSHMSESALASRFEDAVYHIEHHNHDLNFVGKYALSEVPRQYGYKVVLTGEGADEHFGGYPLYLPDYLREVDGAASDQGNLHLSEDEREAVVKAQEEVIKDSYEVMGGTTEFFRDTTSTRELHNIITTAAMLGFTPPFSLFSPWVEKQYSANDPTKTVANNLDPATKLAIREKWHPLHSAMYTWGKGHLTNQFLSCLGDRVEMSHSVEARTPFLDHKLTAYVNSLPPSLKIRYCPKGNSTIIDTPPEELKEDFVEKYALREAVKPYVTDEVYKRRKHPYSAPTTFPKGGPVHEMLEKWVTKERVEKLGFINWGVVEQLMHDAFLETETGAPEKNVSGGRKVWAWRTVLVVAEWVVLHERFGMKSAGAVL